MRPACGNRGEEKDHGTRKGEVRARGPGGGYFMVTVTGTCNAMALLSFLKMSVLS